MNSVPIAITTGDPAGIGPEIVIKLLRDLPSGAVRPVVFGDRRILHAAGRLVGHHPAWRAITPETAAGIGPTEVGLVQVPWEGPTLPDVGQVRATAGAHAIECLNAAVRAAQLGHVAGLVTAPLHKAAVQATISDFIGHTEHLARACGLPDEAVGMLLVAEPLHVLLVTTHLALREVPGKITRDRVLTTIRRLASALADLGDEARPDRPIAVCGLNPHAGEGGTFGDEELTVIGPAIEVARSEGLAVVGPLAADTVFHRACANEFAGVVAMYHDQGLGPLKTVAFERGINMTVGLPFVRTSPDHGTAFDIAGRGVADPGSLRAAWDLAARLATRRRGVALDAMRHTG